jgi:tetratricopeptide (TPR) repeat protein/tRNA A-37 threonylcarbamoyl transferase component Bud32
LDPLRWARLDQLFAAAEPLPAASRAALIERSFADEPDPELQRELEAMLAAAGPAAARVDGAIAGGLAAFAGGDLPPSRLGPYRILREIGRGGMATVYEAERDDREFERKVAVKVLRRGMETADIVRRLRRERQILANLDHPHIARLLDGGSTLDGRPYVVMEHIAGQPIDDYCLSLGLAARLELFRQICDAVHFAHRNLVLHRDIKPSNILVTAEGVPKLLDFGIAKVLEGEGETESGTIEPTLTGWRLLTPEWASPEQVRGEPLSTASDVYSLGLLLHLLVTGERAYQLDPRRPAEVERIVCELEAKSPGRGDDLDLVILAALRKEPARRYASAEQLGEDVRRFLADLPVAARKDTWSYRSAKFVRRHRLAVAAVAVVFVTLLAAALVTREQRRLAEENLARAEQVAAFLTDLFEVSDPREARGRPPTVRTVLDQGVRRMRFSLHDDPRLRADLLGTMGRVYQKLSLYDEASSLLQEAASLAAGGDDRGAAAGGRDLAALELEMGRYESAEKLAKEALRRSRLAERAAPREPALALETAKSLRLVADVEATLARAEAAERLYREALEIQQRQLGPAAEEVSLTRISLGELYYRQGRMAEARALFEDLVAIRRRTLGADHPDLATAINNLAAAEQGLGRWPAAKVLLEEVLAIRRRIFGEEPSSEVAVALNNLATAEAETGQLESAIRHMEEALAINRGVFGGGPHPTVAANLHNLAMFHQRRQETSLAGELYGQALRMRRQSLGENHPAVSQTLRNLGELFEQEAPAAAERYFRQALEIDRHASPVVDSRLANSLAGLGRLAMDRGALAEAEDFFLEEVEIRRRSGPEDWRRPYAELWLGRVWGARGRRSEALALMEKALPELERRLGAAHPRVKQGASFLAEVRRLAGSGTAAAGAAVDRDHDAPGVRRRGQVLFDRIGIQHPAFAAAGPADHATVAAEGGEARVPDFDGHRVAAGRQGP